MSLEVVHRELVDDLSDMLTDGLERTFKLLDVLIKLHLLVLFLDCELRLGLNLVDTGTLLFSFDIRDVIVEGIRLHRINLFVLRVTGIRSILKRGGFFFDDVEELHQFLFLASQRIKFDACTTQSF